MGLSELFFEKFRFFWSPVIRPFLANSLTPYSRSKICPVPSGSIATFTAPRWAKTPLLDDFAQTMTVPLFAFVCSVEVLGCLMHHTNNKNLRIGNLVNQGVGETPHYIFACASPNSCLVGQRIGRDNLGGGDDGYVCCFSNDRRSFLCIESDYVLNFNSSPS